MYDIGWKTPTIRFFEHANLINEIAVAGDPQNYNMNVNVDNDKASSIWLKADWSAMVYEHAYQQGGKKCFTSSDYNLADNSFDNGIAINDNISSYTLYHDPVCGVSSPSDNTPPNAYWNSPANNSTISASLVNLSATATDSHSGMNYVRFSANYGGSWHNLSYDYAAPYTFNWDMCSDNVPNGLIELGLQAYDNAGNEYVYSSNNINLKFTKSYNCGSTPPPTPTDRVRLYDHANYAGELGNYGTDTTNDPNANSYSMQVPSGWSVQTYSGDNLSGESRCWSSSVPNLQDHSWHLKIQSMRIYSSNVCPAPPPSGATWQGKFWRTATCYDDHSQCTDSNTTYQTNYNVPGVVNGRNYIIRQDWGTNSPGGSTPNDEFTGYFRATINFAPGNYVFYSTNDDGLKFKIPGYGEYSTSRDNREDDQQMCSDGGQSYYLNGNYTLEAYLREAGGEATIQIWYDNNTDACIPPLLFWPSNNTSVTDNTPTFDWESKVWGPQYTIAIDGTEYTTSSSDFTPSTPLAYGTHSWRVRARNPYGGVDSPWSDTWQFTIQPPTPTNVQATDGIYADTVQVSWGAVSGASTYEVYRATSETGTKTKLVTVSTTSYSDSAAPIGMGYYWVKACNGTVCSNYSNYDTGYLSRPIHDNFYTPRIMFGMPYGDNPSTANATTDTDDPVFSCVSGQGYNSVWYRFTPSENGNLLIDTFGSNYDTVLAVWTGVRGALHSERCNDDVNGTPQSAIELDVAAGTNYYIEVAGYSTGSYGTLNLTASFAPAQNSESNVYLPIVIK